MDHHQSALLIIAALGLFAPAGRADEASAPQAAVREFRWAPELGLAAPQPIVLGAHGGWREGWEFYADAGYFHFPFTSSERSITIYGIQVGTRYWPSFFPHWLYASGALGFRRVSVSADVSHFRIDDQQIASASYLNMNTLYVVPAIGVQFALSRRLSFQSELGLQIALLSSGSMFLEDGNGNNSDNSSVLSVDSSRAISRVARLPIPQVMLFRLVWSLD